MPVGRLSPSLAPAGYRELLNSYGRNCRTYEEHRRKRDYAYYKSLENLQSLAGKMLHLLEGEEVDKESIRQLLARGEFELVRTILASLRPSRPASESLLDYERKLTASHLFLLEELIAILTLEYDRRILEARRCFERFLYPHRQALEAIAAEIRGIDLDLDRLQAESRLDPEEKQKLLTAFHRRREELVLLSQEESAKLRKVGRVSESLRESVYRFRSLIDSLCRALEAYRLRQSYVDKLARLGGRIPEFRSLLESLHETFHREVGGLQKSFRIFDQSFLDMVFQAIDEQSVTARILHASGRAVAAELELLGIRLEGPAGRCESGATGEDPPAGDLPAADLPAGGATDLSFLRFYHDGAAEGPSAGSDAADGPRVLPHPKI